MKFLNIIAQSNQNQSDSVSGGVILITAIIVAFVVGSLAMYTRLDFKRHKEPLKQIDPNVRYTYIHHVKVVTIPLFKYRISLFFDKH
ncbi:hypothetical protein KC950_00020 [Candidatus Saccharibacteria bacterium]|nr:hypothetical protein [Candidatus Saccharibacteria bacterium]